MGFSKKASFSIDAAYRFCLLTADPARSQTPYYAGKTITIIRGGRLRWLGIISVQSADAVFEEVHTGQPHHHDGVHGRHLREKGGELLLYGETRWAKDGSAGGSRRHSPGEK